MSSSAIVPQRLLCQLGEVSIMTFNILADVWSSYTKVDDAATDAQKGSPTLTAAMLLDEKTRMALVASQILLRKPDVVLLQEAQTSSVAMLEASLTDSYKSCGLAKNLVTSAAQANGTMSFVSLDFVKRLGDLSISIYDDPAWLECGSVQSGSDGSTAQVLTFVSSDAKPLLAIANIHLEYGTKNRETQLRVLGATLIQKLPQGTPTVIAGDFNAIKAEVEESLPASGLWPMVATLGKTEPVTFFSGSNPDHTRQCDHVYMSSHLSVVGQPHWGRDATDVRSCLAIYGSDHVPITVTVRSVAAGAQ